MLNTQEHYDLLEQFERTHPELRRDREPKDFWRCGIIYQDGEVNRLFLVFRQGYALGKVVGRSE